MGTWLAAITGFLFTLARAVGQRNPPELLIHVRRHQLYGDNPESITTQNRHLWRRLEKYLGLHPVDVFRCEPPNSIPSVLQWSVLRALLVSIDVPRREQVRTSFQCTSVTGVSLREITYPLEPFRIIDSHCHMMFTLDKFHVHSVSRVEEESKKRRASAMDFICPAFVCNIAHPTCWATWERLSDCQEAFFAFGGHPLCSMKLTERQLTRATEHPRCVAIGECGYDLSRNDPRYRPDVSVLNSQQANLSLQIRVAHLRNLPLIIHLRGRAGDRDSEVIIRDQLHAELRAVLQPTHRIHFHCFVGEREDYEMWQHAFPNAKFGFTCKLEDVNVRSVARIMRADQLLLESDAPFLTPADVAPKGVRAPNSPYYLDSNLAHMARAFNLPARILARILNENAAQLYSLPDTCLG